MQCVKKSTKPADEMTDETLYQLLNDLEPWQQRAAIRHIFHPNPHPDDHIGRGAKTNYPTMNDGIPDTPNPNNQKWDRTGPGDGWRSEYAKGRQRGRQLGELLKDNK